MVQWALWQVLLSIQKPTSTIEIMNAQIASSAEEQNVVTQEINQSVIEINELASTTNENAEQKESSTQELSNVVDNLAEITSKFRV